MPASLDKIIGVGAYEVEDMHFYNDHIWFTSEDNKQIIREVDKDGDLIEDHSISCLGTMEDIQGIARAADGKWALTIVTFATMRGAQLTLPCSQICIASWHVDVNIGFINGKFYFLRDDPAVYYCRTMNPGSCTYSTLLTTKPAWATGNILSGICHSADGYVVVIDGTTQVGPSAYARKVSLDLTTEISDGIFPFDLGALTGWYGYKHNALCLEETGGYVYLWVGEGGTYLARILLEAPTYSQLTVNSTPVDGFKFLLDAAGKETPFSESVMDGEHVLIFDTPQTIWGLRYDFVRWSDGHPIPTKVINLTEDLTLSGVFAQRATVKGEDIPRIRAAMGNTPLLEEVTRKTDKARVGSCRAGYARVGVYRPHWEKMRKRFERL